MTYADLLKSLQTLNDEQLKADVTVFVADSAEFFPVSGGLCFTSDGDEDRLDDNHPYLHVCA